MTTSMKLAGLCAALVAGSTLFAQQTEAPVVETSSAGLLGKRYVETGLALLDINRSKTDAYATGVAVNLPVTSTIDVGFNYSYNWLEAHSSIDNHAIAASVTEYINVRGFNVFGTLTLGYDWPSEADDDAFWGADLGAEYSFSSTVSASVSAGYSDDFSGPADNGLWDATVRLNHWATDEIALNVSVSVIEGGHLAYGAGVSLKF